MDIGTNSCRLLIAENKRGNIITIRQELRTTRIGQGINNELKRISQEAFDRTTTTLKEYSEIINAYPVDKVILVATQAVREASNSIELKDEIEKKVGWKLDIISGEREAWLSYLGATKGLTLDYSPLVIDIGGGSTEVIIKEKQDVISISIPIGALRLYENPLSSETIEKMLEANLDIAGFGLVKESNSTILVGVGGTCTTTAAIDLALSEYDRNLVHGAVLTKDNIEKIYKELIKLSSQERLKIPGVYKGREDIIVSGMKILLALMKYTNKDRIVVSDEDLLYGLVYDNDSHM